MTCQHCGAELPPIAMFCGECGRSVSAPVVAAPIVERPSAPVAPVPTTPERTCTSCGTPADSDDLYCGECGRPLASDTVIIDPLPTVAESAPQADPSPPPSPPADPPPLATEPPAPTDSSVDTESTRIVPRGTGGARFVLQFSTGESYTVLGSGLAGRNPRVEPGEFVDHLATIADPGRSVSKTHLEFGQHDGVFWVSDRHSGNGSIIREPGAEPRVCEPGRRYPVVRGTRIDLGEQFVVVS